MKDIKMEQLFTFFSFQFVERSVFSHKYMFINIVLHLHNRDASCFIVKRKTRKLYMDKWMEQKSPLVFRMK